MPILSWKTRIQTPQTLQTETPQTQTPQTETSKQLIVNIAKMLAYHYESGNINEIQLNKIYNLATNTDKLKKVLIWLS